MNKTDVSKTTVPICMITDEAYVLPTLVTIKSILENSKKKISYKIIVLSTETLTEKSRKALGGIGDNIRVLSIPMNTVYGDGVTGPAHVSKVALLKFDIADILKEYDRALYVDTDIIVQKDLSELMNVKLGNAYAGVVETFTAPIAVPEITTKLAVKHYFNSGVMLLNLQKMRIEHLNQKFIDYKLNGWNYFMDQDTLNAVFRENVVWLPPWYNLQYTTVEKYSPKEICRLYGEPEIKTIKGIYKKSVIIHYCSVFKPWQFYDTWKADLWYHYYKRLPASIRTLYPVDRRMHPDPYVLRNPKAAFYNRLKLAVKETRVFPMLKRGWDYIRGRK